MGSLRARLRELLADKQEHNVYDLSAQCADRIEPWSAHRAFKRYHKRCTAHPCTDDLDIQEIRGRRIIIANALSQMRDVELKGRDETRTARLLDEEVMRGPITVCSVCGVEFQQKVKRGTPKTCGSRACVAVAVQITKREKANDYTGEP